MKRNAVAQLISRARIKLRDELRGTALASVAVSSTECERALPLLAARADGQLGDDEDADWLSSHVASCDTCQVSEEAMSEAGRSYRAWLPIVPLVYLRRDTIARAGELVGSDWSQVAESPRSAGDAAAGDGGAGTGAGGQGGNGGGAAGADPEGATAVMAGAGAGEPGRIRRTLRSRRRGLFALMGAGALLLGIFTAMVVGDDEPPVDPPETSAPAGAVGPVPVTGGATTTAPGKAPKKTTTTAGFVTTTTTTPTGVVTTTTPAGSPNAPARRRTTRRRQGGTRQGGGGGGPINIPSTPTTTGAPPPPTTTSAPPPTTTSAPPPTTTTTTPRPCRPGIAGCPRRPPLVIRGAGDEEDVPR
jgi:hypothetical protein